MDIEVDYHDSTSVAQEQKLIPLCPIIRLGTIGFIELGMISFIKLGL